ncbi:MAG TPA: exodeoxyribonuclease VII small subunit [Caldithrix abyssi]|uniref:Exodeoxyribonuclease 7 small subunit n=1 Tax=Caldithrix abyssi TaxID=187145 RepID=A0A7V4WWA6_CALAY|nr:exodeoxyribonuclease VII small subunit [Caldithrix abyssi]
MTKKKLAFESALQRLEEIVNKLESGEIPLEESIKVFEEGEQLVRFCMDTLNEAEKKVKKLEKKDDGSFQLNLLDE